jgi:UDP-N-acetylmuramate dehydrogenase
LSQHSPCTHINASLRQLNTFGIDVPCEALIEFSSADELANLGGEEALPRPFHVLGGGSNVLLTGPVQGTVLLNRIKGISVVDEDPESVWLKVGAGEGWHDLVLYAISNSWGGIENLALIPGTVGASPIQNIGAYGVEVKDTITEVEVWDWETDSLRSYKNKECRFGYRDSVFKGQLKGRIVVTAVTFQLSKKPRLNTAYGAIQDELTALGLEPSVQSVAQAVINIRKSKLPDPAVIGNAGSFFKNPTIPEDVFKQLKDRHPTVPSYPAGNGLVKLPAGWLIEYCGWKGRREGEAGVHAKQALVLVNYGNAAGQEIWDLSEAVLKSVKETFGIQLEREVQVW